MSRSPIAGLLACMITFLINTSGSISSSDSGGVLESDDVARRRLGIASAAWHCQRALEHCRWPEKSCVQLQRCRKLRTEGYENTNDEDVNEDDDGEVGDELKMKLMMMIDIMIFEFSVMREGG